MTSCPEAASIALVESPICATIWTGVSCGRCGWFQVCPSTSCPSLVMRASVSAYPLAFSPITKKVAAASRAASSSRIPGVKPEGPSS